MLIFKANFWWSELSSIFSCVSIWHTKMSQKLWHLCRSALILVSPLGIWKMLLNLTFFCLKNQDNNEDRFYWLKRQMMDGLEVFATSRWISHTSNASKLKLVKKHQFASWHQIYGNFQCKIKKLEKNCEIPNWNDFLLTGFLHPFLNLLHAYLNILD